MKYQLINKNKFIIYLNSSYMCLNKENLYDSIKNILIKVRKRYAYDIYGYYDVNIYEIKCITTVIEFIKKDQDDYFKNNVDLKINYINKDYKIRIGDYALLNNFLISSNDIKGSDIIKICEHYSIENLNLQ